jgi:GntR family transcriptional regulator/MocR family aminotransferase
MAKRTGGFELALAPRDPETPAYTWLYERLRDAILGGRLRPGARLPSTRDLARQCGLSRGTVVEAFAQLGGEGYVTGTIGSGTYVSAVVPDELLEIHAKRSPAPNVAPQRFTSRYASRVGLFPAPAPRPTRAFRANLPALDQFPAAAWAQLVARRLRRASAQMLSGTELLGFRPLREAIAAYVGAARGVTCDAERVMIVAGVQDGLDLTARLVLDPGATVCIEQPSYIGARLVLEAASARIAELAVDDDGMVIDRAVLRRARLIYTTPAHQYPLGVAMSLPRRLALLDAIRGSRALVFEDDYDSEYRYSGRPLPALHGLDRAGQVIFAGSFSKVLVPALRLGYLVLPPDLVERFAAARSIMTRHMPVLEQAVLCDFITTGRFGRHLRRMRQLYADRLAVLTKQLAGVIELSPIEAGLQTIGWLPRGYSGAAIANACRERDVEVSPIRWGRREGLQLGFAAVGERELVRGAGELAEVLRTSRRGGSTHA